MKLCFTVTLLLICSFSYYMNTMDVNGNQKEYPERDRSALEANNHNSLNLLTHPENHTNSGSCQKQKLEHGRFQVQNLHSYVDDNAGIIIHCQSITFGTGNYYKRCGAAKYPKFVDPDQLSITSRLI